MKTFAYSNIKDQTTYLVSFDGKALADKGAFLVFMCDRYGSTFFQGFLDYEDLAPEEKVWAIRFLGVPNF